jgi:hypothetical protein
MERMKDEGGRMKRRTSPFALSAAHDRHEDADQLVGFAQQLAHGWPVAQIRFCQELEPKRGFIELL